MLFVPSKMTVIATNTSFHSAFLSIYSASTVQTNDYCSR